MTLASKMAVVMNEVEGIKKSGYNKGLDYYFMTADDIAIEIRNLLAKHGIALYAAMVDHHEEAIIVKTSYGEKSKWRTTCDFVFTLVDADNREDREDCPWANVAIDDQDKGFNKAITAAKKSWLIATFLLSSGDISEEPAQVGDPDASNPMPIEAVPSLRESMAAQGTPVNLPRPPGGPVAVNMNHALDWVKGNTNWTSFKNFRDATGKDPATYPSQVELLRAVYDAAIAAGVLKPGAVQPA